MDSKSPADVNCEDFPTQLDAQRYFDLRTTPENPVPAGLDENMDNVPCEALPGGLGFGELGGP